MVAVNKAFSFYDPRRYGLLCLLVCIPIAMGLFHSDSNEVAQFIFSALAVLPLAGIMGEATEHVAEHAGPGVGGLLNATFGNAAELILSLFAVFNHLDSLVKASITGSIIGNALLVLGASIFAGGLKYKVQRFNKSAVGASATLAVMAACGLVIPALAHRTVGVTVSFAEEKRLSVGVSVVLLFTYGCMLYFSLVTHKGWFDDDGGAETELAGPPGQVTPPSAVNRSASGAGEDNKQAELDLVPVRTTRPDLGRTGSMVLAPEPVPKKDDAWSMKTAMTVLAVTTGIVAYMSEILVHSVEHFADTLGISHIFTGVIIVAIVGNAAEHSTALLTALKNHLDISINIALGSTLQIAMFVAPVIVLISHARGEPMTLVFSTLEIFAVFLSLLVVWMVLHDGESTWVEGVMLLMLYLILALAFLFIPSEDEE